MRVYLREWRIHKDLTMTELARRMKVSKGEISRLEGGSRRFTDIWMGKIAKAMQISPSDLLRQPSGISDVLTTTDRPPPRTGRPALQRDPVKLVTPVKERQASGEAVHGLVPASAGLVLHKVQGSDMSPSLGAGDGAVVDTNKASPITSGLFLIEEMGAEVVRRLQMLPASGKVRIMAEHPSFEPYESTPGDVAVVGRVVARVTSV